MPYDWGWLYGHHPPACTCYRCNEQRLVEEATREEERRVAEYNRRVAESRERKQGQAGQQAPARDPHPQPPNPPVSRPGGTPPSPHAGSTEIARSHPESCPCGICARTRQIEESRRRQAQRQGRAEDAGASRSHAETCSCPVCETARKVSMGEAEHEQAQGPIQAVPAPRPSPQPPHCPAQDNSGDRRRQGRQPTDQPTQPRNSHPVGCVCVDCRRLPRRRERPAPRRRGHVRPPLASTQTHGEARR